MLDETYFSPCQIKDPLHLEMKGMVEICTKLFKSGIIEISSPQALTIKVPVKL